jgi:hypothetical protein
MSSVIGKTNLWYENIIICPKNKCSCTNTKNKLKIINNKKYVHV